VGLGRKLIAGGFGAEQVPTLLRALGDAAAATGAGFEKADEAVGALRRIRAEGSLSTKTLRALSAAGVPTGAVYERLGEVFGVTAQQARELVKAGKVDSSNALFAIVGAVKDKRSGGALGDAAQRYATETLSGLKKSIADKKEELFADIFKSVGFGSFKSFLKNVSEALDPENPIGKRIRERVTSTFNRIFTALFGPLTGDQGLERIEKVVNKVLFAIDALVAAGAGPLERVRGLQHRGPSRLRARRRPPPRRRRRARPSEHRGDRRRRARPGRTVRLHRHQGRACDGLGPWLFAGNRRCDGRRWCPREARGMGKPDGGATKRGRGRRPPDADLQGLEALPGADRRADPARRLHPTASRAGRSGCQCRSRL
jgi:tape measure domain-containing protein